MNQVTIFISRITFFIWK